LSAGLADGAGEPETTERPRTRLASQKASNNPSNRCHSLLRAQNSCLKACRISDGRAA
jgi:hypothetical protein